LNSAYLFSQLNATPTSGAGGTASTPYDPFSFLSTVLYGLPHSNPASGTLADSFLTSAAQSFTGGIVSDSNHAGAAPPPIPVGVNLLMAEDTALRLVGHQLAGDSTLTSEALQFASLGTAAHGRAWIDDNGDIRFQPDADFTGEASFSYFLTQTNGEVVERLAVAMPDDYHQKIALAG
jgi:hypothetical protein